MFHNDFNIITNRLLFMEWKFLFLRSFGCEKVLKKCSCLFCCIELLIVFSLFSFSLRLYCTKEMEMRGFYILRRIYFFCSVVKLWYFHCYNVIQLDSRFLSSYSNPLLCLWKLVWCGKKGFDKKMKEKQAIKTKNYPWIYAISDTPQNRLKIVS